MERVQGGELFTYIDEKGNLPEKETVFLMRQLVEALIYCHRLQIHHRDIKPENILIDRTNLTVKLIDFGMAAFQPDGEFLLTPCGSPHYAAPELLQGMAYDGSKADVWSVAVVCWVMLVGDPPFNYPIDMPEDKKLRYLYDRICAADVKIPNTLSEAAQDFFRRAFVTDPAKRMTIMQLWEHDLLHKFDRDFDYEGREVEHWIGPGPTLKGWKPLTPRTIDPQLLRSVLILWHDANEESVIERLCCDQ
jgi:serine/threonine protein kinase